MPPPLSHASGGGGALALAPLVGADKENQLPAVAASGSSLLHKPLLLHKPAGLSASTTTGTPLRAMMGLSKLGGGALRRPAAAATVPEEEDDDDDELTAAVQAATATAPTATPVAATPTTTTSVPPSTPAKSQSHGSLKQLAGAHTLQNHSSTPKLTSTKPLQIGSSVPVRAASAASLPLSTPRAHSHTHTMVAAPIPSVAAVAAAAAMHSAPTAHSHPPASTPAPTPVAVALPVAPVAVVAPTPVVLAAPVVVAAPAPVVAPTATPAAVAHVSVAAPAVAPLAAAPMVSKASVAVAAPPPAASSTPTAAAVLPAAAAASSSQILQSFTEVRTKHGFMLNGTEYSKLRTIGKGGSSLVYLVCSPTGQLFALKEMILPAADAASAEAAAAHVPDYVTEVSNMLAMKGSPHVAQLHLALEQMSAPTAEFDDDPAAPPRSHATRVYMLMEAGVCDLDTHLTQVRSELSMTPFSVLLPSYTVRWLWAQMLRCIAAVHAKGIIHTDLKPVNFILGGEKASLKLIDFGIAKQFDVDAGATSALNDKPVGTLNYMSPESLSENVRLRSSTDIWSAGCILYAWIYGEAPFARFQKLPAKMHAISNAREHIAFPARIRIKEEVLSAEQEKDRSFLKGTGLSITIEAARPGSKDGSVPPREASCSITKTYRRLPAHLEGLPLPHMSERSVGEEVRQVLRACLQRQPEQRPTALQLLAHPYTAGGDEMGSGAAAAAAASNTADPAALTALQTELASARAAASSEAAARASLHSELASARALQASEAAARAALQSELVSARAVQAQEAAARAMLQSELESLRAAQESAARHAAESAARSASESASRADMESRSRCVSLKSRLAFQAALLQLVDKVCRKSLEKAASARVNYARPRRDLQ